MMNTGKIGVAMTTYNRREVALNAIDKWRSYMPDNSIIIIVDDGSTTPFPNATFRFARNKGIAVAKTSALNCLLMQDVNTFFWLMMIFGLSRLIGGVHI